MNRTVTPIDGRKVDSASEDWRHFKRRGEEAGQALKARATTIYSAERQGSNRG
jgi:hypothetical protein